MTAAGWGEGCLDAGPPQGGAVESLTVLHLSLHRQ